MPVCETDPEIRTIGGRGGDERLHLHLGKQDANRNQKFVVRLSVPIGEEPEELIDHLKHCEKFHKYFPSGTGDIFPIDTTVHKNNEFLLDIIKGSFREGIRYLSFYATDSDVIRITGYLVKRSEIEKLEKGENVLQDTTALGMGAKHNGHILERKVR